MYTHSTEAGWVSRSHQGIAPFGLERPTEIPAAVAVLSREGAAAFAGGIDMIRRMRAGDSHATLVDLSALPGIDSIRADADSLHIGARATHWRIETDAILAERCPAFRKAWTTIGNVRVRMAGTVGGNVMAREPGYDGRVLLGALGATLSFATADGAVEVPADADDSAWPAGGLLTHVDVPLDAAGAVALDRSLKPVVSVAACVRGGIARIGIGCAYPAPVFRELPVGDLGKLDGLLPEPVSDPVGSAGYRRRMISVLAGRLVRSLADGK